MLPLRQPFAAVLVYNPVKSGEQAVQPLAIVTINNHPSARVEIYAYSAIYDAVGVTSERFEQWHRRYGYDSLGVGEGGLVLAPDYPVFSKVMDMFVDPVDLATNEAEQLILECCRAELRTEDEDARRELKEIRDLAVTAIRQNAVLRFGHS